MITKVNMVNETEEEYTAECGISLATFADKVERSLQEYFGPDAGVSKQMIRKNNGIILHGITVSPRTNNVAPTLYMEDFYTAFVNGVPYSEIISRMIIIYDENRQREEMDVEFFTDYERVKTRLGYKLINYKMNKQLLEEVPHEKFLDLAIICYCVIVNEQIGNGSILIHKEHLNIWKIDQKELFADAKRNMPRIFKAEWQNMVDVMFEMLGNKNPELPSLPLEELRLVKPQMYVLGNNNRLFGAASILYENVLDQIVKEMKCSDIYILPSSIHEVILMGREEGCNEENLSKMVQEINQTELLPDEILSNHAYLYSGKKKQIFSLPLIPE